MHESRRRWDERYAGRPQPSPRPPEIIAARPELLEAVPSTGRALDLACGSGAQSLWLAQRGLSVVAIDVSPVAIDLLRSAAAESGASEVIDARVHDLDAESAGGGIPDDLVDFDVVICQRFRTPDLYRPIITALTDGGLGIVTVLSAVGAAGSVGRFHAEAGELSAAFAQTDVLAHDERDGVASIVFRRRP